MRKLFVLLLAVSLLLTGCAGMAGPLESAEPTLEPTPAPETTAAPAAPETEPAPTSEAAATEVTAATEPAPTTQVPSTEAPLESTEAPEPFDPWSLIGVASFYEGSFTDQWGNEYTYSFEIPCLLADTEGARAINAAIDERFGSHVREVKKAVEEDSFTDVIHIGFRGEVWEDVLTLVVTEHYDFDWADYGVYCYDVTTGRQLTTPMLLARMGISEADFLECCRQRFRDRFVEVFREVPEEFRGDANYYDQLEAQSSDEYVNLGLMAYPTEDGLVVVAPIMSLAGPAFVYEAMPLGLD